MEIENLNTAPTVEPLDIEDAKKHLNVMHDEDDLYIAGLISTARASIEAHTSRAMYRQTWTRYLDGGFPPSSGCIQLSRFPIIEVSSIKYLDSDNVQQTLSSSVYKVDAVNGRIGLDYDQTWPTVLTTVLNPIEVEYVAGYVDNVASPTTGTVPADMLHAMRLLIGTHYRNRESLITGTIATDLSPIGNILDHYRLYHI